MRFIPLAPDCVDCGMPLERIRPPQSIVAVAGIPLSHIPVYLKARKAAFSWGAGNGRCLECEGIAIEAERMVQAEARRRLAATIDAAAQASKVERAAIMTERMRIDSARRALENGKLPKVYTKAAEWPGCDPMGRPTDAPGVASVNLHSYAQSRLISAGYRGEQAFTPHDRLEAMSDAELLRFAPSDIHGHWTPSVASSTVRVPAQWDEVQQILMRRWREKEKAG